MQSGHYRFGLQFHRFRRARSEFKLLCLNYLPFFQKFQLQLLRRIVAGQRDRHREFHRRIRPHRLRHPEFAKRSVARLPQLRTEFHRKHRSRSASRTPAGNIAAVAQHHRRRQSARAVKFIQFRKRTAPVGGKLRLRRFARRQPVVEGVARDRSGVSETAQEAVRKRIRRVEPGFAVRIGDLHRSRRIHQQRHAAVFGVGPPHRDHRVGDHHAEQRRDQPADQPQPFAPDRAVNHETHARQRRQQQPDRNQRIEGDHRAASFPRYESTPQSSSAASSSQPASALPRRSSSSSSFQSPPG